MYLVPGGWCLVPGEGMSGPRWGGVYSQGGRGMSVPRGCLLWVCVVSQHALRQTPQPTPLVNRMTDRCKNITLATTLLRPVKIDITGFPLRLEKGKMGRHFPVREF